MADCADIANTVIEKNLAHSLAARSQHQSNSLFECIECDSTIPEQRRKLGGVTRCIECQSRFERTNKG